MTLMLGQPLVLVARTVASQDAYGNDVYGFATTLVFGAFTPGGSSELVQGRDTVIGQPTVYLPAGISLGSLDAVVVHPVLDASGQPVLDRSGKPEGEWFEVDGTPNVWVSPFTGWRAGVEVRLQGVTG